MKINLASRISTRTRRSHLQPAVVLFALWIGLLLGASAFAQRRLSSARANVIGDRSPQQALTSSATAAWTLEDQFTPNTGLSGQSAVYDPATNAMIVFGGDDAGLGLVDTNAVLLLANANGSGIWSTLIANGAAGSPPARDAHTAIYDVANNRMIIFAGEFLTFGANATLLDDLWVLSNANGQGGTPTWAQLSPSGTPPAAREGHSAVYDATNNRMIVFGGFSSTGTFSDVWVLSNANGLGGTPAWTQLLPTGGPPSGVAGASAVYDPKNNIMTVFGGFNPSGTVVTNAIWTLSHANGLGGTAQWTNIVANGAAGSPSKRWAHSAIYDVTNNRMTIFGGGNVSGFPGFNDVWVLANANGLGGTPTWTRLKPTGTLPGTRLFHTAVYDAANNLMIVFAGGNSDAQYYVPWVLSHANGL